MTLSFDPDAVALPGGHFIGGAFEAAPGAMVLRRPSDGVAFAEAPVADAFLASRIAGERGATFGTLTPSVVRSAAPALLARTPAGMNLN